MSLVSGGWDSMAQWRLLDLPPALHLHTGSAAQDREHAVVTGWADRWGGEVTCVEMPPMPEWGNGWVPHRNLLLLTVAAQHGNPIYLARVAEWAPDKNGRYLRLVERLLRKGMTGATQGAHDAWRIVTPYAALTKRGLRTVYAARFGEQEADALWAGTWSCYGPGPERCGECAGCAQRAARLHPQARWQDGARWLRDDGVLAVRQMTARWREARDHVDDQ